MGNLKIWVRLTAAIWFVLVIVWTGMIAWESQANRETAIRQAQDFAQSIHEMTMAGLTGMMITGTIGQREVFLDQIKQLSIIKDLHVARGEAVSKLYGPDTKGARELDAVEKQVMQDGKPYVAVEADEKGSFLRVVNPTRAAKNYLGKDCIMCHQVPEHTVLGVVSMKVSLDSVEQEVASFRLKIAGVAAAVSLLLLFVIYFFTRRFVTNPIEELKGGLQDIAHSEALPYEFESAPGMVRVRAPSQGAGVIGPPTDGDPDPVRPARAVDAAIARLFRRQPIHRRRCGSIAFRIAIRPRRHENHGNLPRPVGHDAPSAAPALRRNARSCRNPTA